jgi:hypothetical protein
MTAEGPRARGPSGVETDYPKPLREQDASLVGNPRP